MDLITRFEQGKMLGFGLPDRVIDVQISKIFFFGDRVVKVYKHQKQFFADLADARIRKEFYREDFYWNHAMSPEIYEKCVRVVDGDDEDFYIEMHRVDGEQTLTKRLIAGAVTEDTMKRLVETLVQSLRRITVGHREKLQPLFLRGLLNVHIDSLEDLRHFAYLADAHIPRSDADAVVNTLIERSTKSEYFLNEHEHRFSAAIDNNPDNVLIIDGDIRFIDVMPPKESWRVADEYLTIVRNAVDAYVLGRDEIGDAVYEAYRYYSLPIPETVTLIYEIRAAMIQRVYRHILGQHDIAGMYREFLEVRFHALVGIA